MKKFILTIILTLVLVSLPFEAFAEQAGGGLIDLGGGQPELVPVYPAPSAVPSPAPTVSAPAPTVSVPAPSVSPISTPVEQPNVISPTVQRSPVVNTSNVSGDYVFYTGKLLKDEEIIGDKEEEKGDKKVEKKVSSLNTYFLDVKEGDNIQIDTARDLDDYIGKEITIKTKGTRTNFVVYDVLVGGKALPTTGPAETITFVSLLSLAGTILLRKKSLQII